MGRKTAVLYTCFVCRRVVSGTRCFLANMVRMCTRTFRSLGIARFCLIISKLNFGRLFA